MSPTQDHWRAAAILALWVAATVWLRWGVWAPDLSALLIAGWLWEHGHRDLIYAIPPGFFTGSAPAWAEAMATMGVADQITYPYFYPPVWVVLIAPLTAIWSPQTLMNAALLVQVPMLAGSAILAGRLAKPAAMNWTLWAFWGVGVLSLSAPSYMALMHLQLSIVMGFVILLAFVCLTRGQSTAFGALIALAAAIKLTPALLVLAAVTTRDRRALLAFALVGAGLSLLSIWLAGWPAHAAMIASLRETANHTLMVAHNIAVESILVQFWNGPDILPAVVPTPAAIGILSRVLALLATALLLWRAPSFALADRPLVALLGLSLVIWLLGPLGWLHYYLILLLLLPGLARLIPQRRAWFIGGSAAFITAMPLYLAASKLTAFHTVYPALANFLWLILLASLLAGRKTAPIP